MDLELPLLPKKGLLASASWVLKVQTHTPLSLFLITNLLCSEPYPQRNGSFPSLHVNSLRELIELGKCLSNARGRFSLKSSWNRVSSSCDAFHFIEPVHGPSLTPIHNAVHWLLSLGGWGDRSSTEHRICSISWSLSQWTVYVKQNLGPWSFLFSIRSAIMWTIQEESGKQKLYCLPCLDEW